MAYWLGGGGVAEQKKKIMSCRSHICRILLFCKLFTLLWAESNRNFDLFVKELSGFTSSSLRSIFHLPTPLLRGLIIGMACPYRVTQTRREKRWNRVEIGWLVHTGSLERAERRELTCSLSGRATVQDRSWSTTLSDCLSLYWWERLRWVDDADDAVGIFLWFYYWG